MNIDDARKAEHDKYLIAYKHPNYRMGKGRMTASIAALYDLHAKGSYLDVGCGRGEMLDIAKQMGYEPVQGTEVIEPLINNDIRICFAPVYNLPFDDNSIDVVTLFDVIEHILPADTERALSELNRVAKKHILLTAANYPSKSMGIELHINIKEYTEWDACIRENMKGKVTWLPRINGCNSELWRVDI